VASGDPHTCMRWLRAGLAAALLVAPYMSAGMAAEARPAAEHHVRSAAPATRFSELAEITPANVGGLMPLVARSVAVTMQDAQFDSSAAVERPLRRFADVRTDPVELMREERAHPHRQRVNCVVSYLVASGDADTASGPAAAALAQHELRAWDPIERHVLWSVREALPISSGMLVTAGGLVFYGTVDGWLKALDARSGRMLWKHRVDGKRLDAPLSYRGSDGHQYIAVRASQRGAGDGAETHLLFALAH
jgi:hypothetical protein